MNRTLNVVALVLLVAMIALVAGCAQAPTQKVEAVKAELAAADSLGAKVFAPAEFDAIAAGIMALEGLVAEKKNKEAASMADSLATEIATLKTTTTTNAQGITEQAVAVFTAQFDTLKGLLTPENAKLVGDETAQAAQAKVAELEAAIATIQAKVGEAAYLEAFNMANTANNDAAAVTQDFAAKLAAAKPAKRR